MAFDSSLHYKDQGSMQGSYTMVTITSWWRRGAGDALSGNAPRCPCSEHGDVVVLAPPLLAYQKRSPPSSHLLRIAKTHFQTDALPRPARGRDVRRPAREAREPRGSREHGVSGQAGG